MKFAAKGKSDFKIADAGTHPAIVNAVVDFGLQPPRGQFPDPEHEVYIRFELCNELVEYEKDGQKVSGPMSIGRRFTASMNAKSNLRKFIEGLFGKSFPTDEAAADFDLHNLLGRKGLLNVVHDERNGKVYANIRNASPLPKGMSFEHVKQHNESLFYDLSAPDEAMFKKLPTWMQEIINTRLVDEPKATGTAEFLAEYEKAGPIHDDDVPF